MSNYYLIDLDDISNDDESYQSFIELNFPQLLNLYQMKHLLKSHQEDLKGKLHLLKCELEIKYQLRKYNMPVKLLFEVNDKSIVKNRKITSLISVYEVNSDISIDVEISKLKKYNISRDAAELYMLSLSNSQKTMIQDKMEEYENSKLSKIKRIAI